MRLPLPTLLSQPLVAYTIEIDHAFETRLPHRTAETRRSGEPRTGPWLTSYAMWANFLRYVGDGGRSLADVREQACLTSKTLHVVANGMERWGYITLGPGKGEARPVSPTANGRRAAAAWRPLPDEVDGRWAELRPQLRDFPLRHERRFPRFLPIARYEAGLRAEVPDGERRRHGGLSVGELLAQLLLAFTVEYEAESQVSLAVAANYLRALTSHPVSVRTLPGATGTSKEAVSFATKFLARNGLAETGTGASAQVRLTAAGLEAQEHHRRLVDEVEGRWRERYGGDVEALRGALEPVVGGGTLASSPLAEAVAPPPGTWRATRETPQSLPHHPLVLHRGGYPDGS
jgi:DNA-binding MarR family transcriptional regulator